MPKNAKSSQSKIESASLHITDYLSVLNTQTPTHCKRNATATVASHTLVTETSGDGVTILAEDVILAVTYPLSDISCNDALVSVIVTLKLLFTIFHPSGSNSWVDHPLLTPLKSLFKGRNRLS